MTDWMGWHFSDESECLRYGDGRKIVVGVTHTVDCEPVLCKSGLHASKYVCDALQYAPGPILWRVSLSGKVVHGDDKSCSTERSYHARIDATDALRAFARKCALDVIHLWDAPSVVREYLETGNEELRAATWEAASATAWDATSVAASATASAAARAAASDTAWDVAWEAARVAARVAAKIATWDDVWVAAWDDVWVAALAVQRDTLEKMVTDAMGFAS